MDIDKDDDPQEDMTEFVEHLTKENGELAKIESLSLVHAASKHFRIIPGEVMDSLHNSPGAHVGRYFLLVGKLKVVEAEDVSKEVDSDPVDLLEDERCYANTSVVLGYIDTSQFVLDNGD